MKIERTMRAKVAQASRFFPVVLVTGPRQVGKTTLLKSCAKANRRYVSLDSLENRRLAQRDPQQFLSRFEPPVLIDEIQVAPELFPYIKIMADESQRCGDFWITGSQQFALMRGVTESLAGRVGVLNLQGLSQAEKVGQPQRAPFLPEVNELKRLAKTSTPLSISRLYHRIWKGSFPRLFAASDAYWESFYSSYLQTYIERDVRQIQAIDKEHDFLTFMRVLAARTGQLLNYSDVARDVGVSITAIKSWVSILETSGLVFLLYPFSGNLTSRVIKTPKIYFLDTGLAAFLTKWRTPETLEVGAMSGAIFETYAVSEVLKSYWHHGMAPSVYFYRDKDGQEIDLIIEKDGTLFPIELKKRSNPSISDTRVFRRLEKFGKVCGAGAVLCSAPTWLPLDHANHIIPMGWV